jgi:hypothetical protein
LYQKGFFKDLSGKICICQKVLYLCTILIKTQIMSAITELHTNLAERIVNELKSIGVETVTKVGDCTIDICFTFEADYIQETLKTALFRVFWRGEVEYLCAGVGFFDGYEITRGWSKQLDISEIISTYQTDKTRVEAENQKTKKFQEQFPHMFKK